MNIAPAEEAKRSFHRKKLILLAVILALQIGIILLTIFINPKPEDVIRLYEVTVEPQDDGTLDITYHILWEPQSSVEDLTWVQIGTANPDYRVIRAGNSISSWSRESDEAGLSLLRLDLDRGYEAGDVLELDFTINQQRMLCRNSTGDFYEFVPGWFNAIPVKQYRFRWKQSPLIQSTSADGQGDGYYEWWGSLECGGYRKMTIQYGEKAFPGATAVSYSTFWDGGCTNELKEEKAGFIFLAVIVVLALAVAQVWIIDSMVSYRRGRGFLRGYGHSVHSYGTMNRNYIRARDKYRATHAGSRGGGGGGGCACACACACAGGGRAGCSQKDTRGTETDG